MYLRINSRSGGRWIVGEGRYVGQNKVCSKTNVHSPTGGIFEKSGGLGSGIENILDRVFPGSLFTLGYIWVFQVFCLRNKM